MARQNPAYRLSLAHSFLWVLVVRDQPLANDQHLAFAQRLDGRLHTETRSRSPVGKHDTSDGVMRAEGAEASPVVATRC